MHVTDINYKNINKIKISEEEIPLNLNIAKLYDLLKYRIELRKTDISLMNVSNISDLSKVLHLAIFYFNYYQSINFV